MVYVGLQYSAEAQRSVSSSVRCAHCGREDFRRASSVGTGSAAAPFFLFRASAKAEASAGAAKNAVRAARLKIRTAACTHCRKRNLGWVLWLAATQALYGLAPGMIVFAFATIASLGSARGSHASPILTALLWSLPVLFGTITWRVRRALRRADMEVFQDSIGGPIVSAEEHHFGIR